MAQSKILLDTNSYLRLAKSIHPLLFQEFGVDSHCLYVLDELDRELNASIRLQTKFEWASESDYRENRKHRLSLSRRNKKDIENAFSFVWDHVQTEHPGPSRIDALHIAHAHVLQIALVSDDRDLLEVSAAFSVSTMRSLELLRLMVDCRHITIDKVTEIVAYWRYWKDTPSDLDAVYSKLFGK